jgi:hypothetical protein
MNASVKFHRRNQKKIQQNREIDRVNNRARSYYEQEVHFLSSIKDLSAEEQWSKYRRELLNRSQIMIDDFIHGPENSYGRTGRYWVQKRKFNKRGARGYALVEAFEGVNRTFDRLSDSEIEAALMDERALFVVVGDQTAEKHREPLVTNWISNFQDLARLEDCLADRFDLQAVIAVDANMGWSEPNPPWKEYPHAQLHRYTVLPKCRVEEWVENTDVESLDLGFFAYPGKTIANIQNLVTYGPHFNQIKFEWAKLGSRYDIEPNEELAIKQAFLFVFSDFLCKTSRIKWGAHVPENPFLSALAGQGLDYTDRIMEQTFKQATRKGVQIVELPDGTKEMVSVFC